MNKVNVSKFFMVMLLVFLVGLFGDDKVYADEQAYFDESGNLIYVTHDKKATSTVSYKAIGWIIKRYDGPMDAEGQQYAIVRKIEYAVEDPEDSAYLYCYFWSSKDEILSAVEKVSPEWRAQMEKYGGMVYIDNVMTVCNSKVPLGNVDGDGNCTGEVYYTFEGIKAARAWAKPDFLKAYFDIKLEFPCIYEEPGIELEEDTYGVTTLVSNNFSSMQVASNEWGREVYDVSVAMPAGEPLYFNGSSDKYLYEINCNVYYKKVLLPVRVDTQYTINWVDRAGNAQSETRNVSEWYQVPKEISYTEVADYKIYDLSAVFMYSDLLTKSEKIYDGSNIAKVSVEERSYGDYINHLQNTTFICNTEGVVLSSDNYIKPAIPEGQYMDVAESAVENVQIKSDYLSIENKVVLSDAWGNNSGATAQNIKQSVESVYRYNVETSQYADNVWYDDFVMECWYVERNDNSTVWHSNENINGVNIHTPIVCNGDIYGEKKINQAESPNKKDLVLGGRFYVNVDCFGQHNSIKGYGIRDYSKYRGASYVKFEFSVNKGDNLFEAGKWIKLDNGINEFRLPEDTKLGKYKAEFKTVAKNGIGSTSIGEGYNKNQNQYGASETLSIDVIGRLYDLEITSDEVYAVGNKNKDGRALSAFNKKILPDSYKINDEKSVDISITTMGELSDNATIEGDVKYYYLNNNTGEMIEVDLYKESDTLQLTEPKLLNGDFVLTRNSTIYNGDNTYTWTMKYQFPYNFVAVSKGTDIKDLFEQHNQILKDGTILIVFDFKLINNCAKTITYLNAHNFKMGYCNMWRLQGGTGNITLNNKSFNIMDGTVMITEVGATTKYDYEVNGTH